MNAQILNRNPQLPADRWHQIEAPGKQPTSDGRLPVLDARAASVAASPPGPPASPPARQMDRHGDANG